MTTHYTQIDTPIGQLLATSSHALGRHHYITGLHQSDPQPDWQQNNKLFDHLRRQLDQYFHHKRQRFVDLSLLIVGTNFQINVWQALKTIPYGTTITYADLAKRINKPTAFRAVGQAINRNPVLILIPCHRVIGTNHKLTGFAAGLNTKAQLLALEQ